MDTMSETMAYSSPFTTDVGDTESGLLTIGSQDYSNLEDLQYIDYVNNMDTDQVDKVNDAIAKTANLPDEMRNPVITPILDDTQFWKDYGNFETTWNKKTYDEFAIDANSSMLVREKASGDAATDGNVTYNFTQYNNSPKELSPIQVYRDTKNLIRGSGNFTLS